MPFPAYNPSSICSDLWGQSWTAEIVNADDFGEGEIDGVRGESLVTEITISNEFGEE